MILMCVFHFTEKSQWGENTAQQAGNNRGHGRCNSFLGLWWCCLHHRRNFSGRRRNALQALNQNPPLVIIHISIKLAEGQENLTFVTLDHVECFNFSFWIVVNGTYLIYQRLLSWQCTGYKNILSLIETIHSRINILLDTNIFMTKPIFPYAKKVFDCILPVTAVSCGVYCFICRTNLVVSWNWWQDWTPALPLLQQAGVTCGVMNQTTDAEFSFFVKAYLWTFFKSFLGFVQLLQLSIFLLV